MGGEKVRRVGRGMYRTEELSRVFDHGHQPPLVLGADDELKARRDRQPPEHPSGDNPTHTGARAMNCSVPKWHKQFLTLLPKISVQETSPNGSKLVLQELVNCGKNY